MDLPDDKCQMKRIIERKENRRDKKDCMEEMSDKKTNIGAKIKLDEKLYRVDRWCYFTDNSTKYSK